MNEKPEWNDCPNQCDYDSVILSTNMRCSACQGYKPNSTFSDRLFEFMSNELREQAARYRMKGNSSV